jgi:hypothetical protein
MMFRPIGLALRGRPRLAKAGAYNYTFSRFGLN